jgi:hypothetical protein
MDDYMDFRIGSPKKPDPKHDLTRTAMGIAKKLSERVDLISMTPQKNLASSRYCLANTGKEYLVYITRESDKNITLKLKPGTYSVEWINPSSGKSYQTQAYQSKSNTASFMPSFKGPAILYLRKQ